MQSRISCRVWAAIGVVGILVVGVAVGYAQQIWAGGYGNREPPRFPTQNTFAGSFNFCRIMFTSDRREKSGWRTDYPGADINFSIRLAELTKADVKMDNRGGAEGGDPDAVVVR